MNLFPYIGMFTLFAIIGVVIWLLERRLAHGPFRKKSGAPVAKDRTEH